MPDREKVIKGLEFTKAMITFNPSTGEYIEPGNLNEEDKTTYDACVGAIDLLKEQDNEAKRIMKVIWDTLHEGLSIDTVADQDWVYELIRHRIEDRKRGV